MQNKILVGFDGSESSMKAIDYVGFLFQGRTDVLINILHLMNPLPEIPEESDLSLRKKLNEQKERLEKERKVKAQEMLTRAKEVLLRKNFSEENVIIETDFRVIGKARDLLQKAEKESAYDVVAVGRRGLGMFSKMVMGSVSTEIVQLDKTIPVMVVGGLVPSKKVLISVDDSRNSLRAVDYASFILGKDWDIDFTLFSALPTIENVLGEDLTCQIDALDECYLADEEKRMNDFFAKAKEVFQKAGVSSSRVKTKLKKKSRNVANDIRDEVINGNYGTVILGRGGQSGLKSFFMGSVSLKTLALIEDRGLWIVG